MRMAAWAGLAVSLTSKGFQVSMKEAITARYPPPPFKTANRAVLRFRASGRIASSTVVGSILTCLSWGTGSGLPGGLGRSGWRRSDFSSGLGDRSSLIALASGRRLRPSSVLTCRRSILGRAAADLGFALVEHGEAGGQFRRDRRGRGGVIGSPTHIAPAVSQPHRAAFGQSHVDRVTAHLEHACKPAGCAIDRPGVRSGA